MRLSSSGFRLRHLFFEAVDRLELALGSLGLCLEGSGF